MTNDFAPSYKLTLTFRGKSGGWARKVHRGLPWEKAMNWKTGMLNNDACVSAVMEPERRQA